MPKPSVRLGENHQADLLQAVEQEQEKLLELIEEQQSHLLIALRASFGRMKDKELEATRKNWEVDSEYM